MLFVRQRDSGIGALRTLDLIIFYFHRHHFNHYIDIISVNKLGAPGSPYTRKMLSLMRYREIPFRVHWMTGEVPEGFPKPKVRLLPTYFLPGKDGALEAVTDSTPLIRRFEKDYEGRSVIPDNRVLSFLTDLIEDYADEWLTKARMRRIIKMPGRY